MNNNKQLKWINVDTELPKDDRTVLVWINDTENPQWSGYKLGSYLNEKWYCKGGRKSHEIVTDWCQIPAKKKQKGIITTNLIDLQAQKQFIIFVQLI